ncbi:MAG: 30S ribosomal protein S1 [Anaerolineae bacterium]
MSTMFPESSEEEMADFAAMLDDYYEFDEPERGDIREAEILHINRNEIVVDLGVKRDGIVPGYDIDRLPPRALQNLNVGDRMPVYILNPMDEDGNLIVSINLGLQQNDWERVYDLLETGDMVDATVTGFNKGGALVKFGRLEGFVPDTHIAEIPQGLEGEARKQAMERLIGSTLSLKVIEVNQKRRRLIFSQREAQREWRSKQKERLLDELTEGEIVEGKVTGVRDFGVFVNVGGADGLIHVSELAWHRVPHPGDVVDIGDTVNVYILDLDQEKKRIALSLKRTRPDPWEPVEETYRVEQIVEGKVSNVVEFGAFVVLPDGIEGLLHVTEMVDGSLTEPFSHVKRGDTLVMKVVRIEKERKRIGFTQKELGLTHPTGRLPEEMAEDIQPRTDSVQAIPTYKSIGTYAEQTNHAAAD